MLVKRERIRKKSGKGNKKNVSEKMIDVVSGSTATILSYTTALFSDLWIVVALVIGIPLAFYVIRKVVGLVRMH